MNTPEFDTTSVTAIPDRPDVVRKRVTAFFSGAAILLMIISVRIAILLMIISVRIAILAASPPSDGRWRTFVIPALRGRILDADGRPLAWSTRFFFVTYRRAESELVVWQDLRELQDACGWNAEEMAALLKQLPQPVVTLQRDLTPETMVAFKKNLSNHPRLTLAQGFKRHHWSGMNDRLAVWLGRTRQFGRREVGISGLEKKLNKDLLSGKDGKVRVLVDDDGDWIAGTECPVQEHRPGFDRYVDFRTAN